MGRVSLLILSLLAGQFPTTLSGQSHESPANKGRAGWKCGPVADQLFKCPKFGFTVRVPFGWVHRTDDMQGKTESVPDGSVGQTAEQSGSQLLLAIFERPPEVVGNTINSAIVISTEPLASYPGIKSAADYFSQISDTAREHGFSVASEPYHFLVGSRRLIRGDFSRQLDKLTMWQSSLVMIENHSIVAFTFIAGSDEEIDDLLEQLSFSSPKPK